MFYSDDDNDQGAYLRRRPSGFLHTPGMQVIAVFVALITVAVSAFAAGYVAAGGGQPNPFGILQEAWSALDKYFYYPKPDQKDQVNSAIQGLVSSFKDPHTLFLPPEPASQVSAAMRGETGGIGVTLSETEDKRFVIIEVRRGWAYDQNGGEAGDEILAVDGVPVAGKTLNEVADTVRGPLNTQVTLTIKRAEVDDPIEITCTRTQINVYGEMLPDNIAYLTFNTFNQTAPDEIRRQLETLLAKKPRALILDIRNNGGGLLDESIAIADFFLEEGLVALEKLFNGETRKFTAKSGDLAETIPLVLLVNQRSASASEILAGAIQDRKRGILVGQRTYGKGSVQGIFTLSDGSQLRVTQGAWYTPNETPIEGRDGQPSGLAPDIEVPLLTTGEIPFRDSELEAAVDHIKKTY
ncbi:MAG: hypothetical protein OHK0023_10460 [Anaerolineae bacterium]